jgi:hypothetical protein
MAETDNKQIVEREIREAELQMTGRPPASPAGFIGFVPATPAPTNGGSSDGGGIPSADPATDTDEN